MWVKAWDYKNALYARLGATVGGGIIELWEASSHVISEQSIV